LRERPRVRWVSLAALALLPLSRPVRAGEAVAPARSAFALSLEKVVEDLLVPVHGFFEARAGTRTQRDPRIGRTASLAEARLQLELSKSIEVGDLRPEFRLKTDFLYDAFTSDTPILTAILLQDASVLVREASVLFSPLDFADVKLGRQVLTWATGDLLFINDLFPKDYVSFFIGRDDEYLKAPSDAAKVSLFSDYANLDLVYTPRFRPDEYVTGKRLSYFNPFLGRLAGEDNRLRAHVPHDWIDDDELAARLYKTVGGYELALYGYHGFWRTPGGFNPGTGRVTFPPLAVYGASARGPVGKGIGSVEIGYYDSRDDRDGDNPLVNNSEFRLLLGYEQELAKNFTGGVQYYLEWLQDYGDYRRTLMPGAHPRDEFRHVFTVRLTRLLMNQNLRLSFFAFYSPSDSDAYLRPQVRYRINDNWSADAGGNVFLGAHDHSFFGQFEHDTNAYAGLRYSF